MPGLVQMTPETMGVNYGLPERFDRDILLGTGVGADTQEEWRKWISKSRIRDLRRDFRQMGIDELMINRVLGPPEGEAWGWR